MFFRSRNASPPVRRIDGFFPYPVPNCPRLAIFSRAFEPDGPIRIATDAAELPALDVQSVAASMAVIRAIDPRRWSPEFPVVVLSAVGGATMSEADRDYIWDTFGVPAFEYLLDASGRIVARECEAHDGLHIEAGIGSDEFPETDDPCPCGRSGPKMPAAANAII